MAAPSNLDHAMKVADAALSEDSAARRPQNVLEELQRACNVTATHRLAYRPQPLPSQVEGFGPEFMEFSETCPDLGLQFLMSEGLTLMNLFGSLEIMRSLKTQLIESKVHLLTCLDAASLLSREDRGELISKAVHIIEDTVSKLKAEKGIWQHHSGNDPPLAHQMVSKFVNCVNYAFVQRLMFYNARLHGDSFEKYLADLTEIKNETQLPEGFDLFSVLDEVAEYDRHELTRTNELWAANVELEWVGSPIPIEEVSTPVGDTTGIDCIVCRETLTPPGVQTPCNHSYCKDCFQSWIHACQPASHLCPSCRTQLFAKPDYKPKDLEMAANYAQMAEGSQTRLRLKWEIEKSCQWLKGEVELQHVYEQTKANAHGP